MSTAYRDRIGGLMYPPAYAEAWMRWYHTRFAADFVALVGVRDLDA
jgi:hypothetical protein